jgi:Mg2+ and Co2+ transporter CorA
MNINYYRIIDDSNKALERVENFLEQWRQGEGSYWVDIRAYEIDELEAWLDNLHLSDLAVQCCRDAGRSTRFIPLREEVFFEFPVYAEGGASELVYLSFLCIQNLIVSLHAAPLASLDEAIKGLTSEVTLTQPTTSALVCLLLLWESAKSLKISEALKKTVFDLDERMDDNPDSIKADEILDQKRSLRTLDTVVGAQLSCSLMTKRI